MLYIQKICCISPQPSFTGEIPAVPAELNHKQLTVVEPVYEGVSPGALRRLSKSARIGIGSFMPLLQDGKVPDGIIIGSANGGMEDSIRFLKQIIEYEEDMLAPGSFVQSTGNAVASQMSMLTQNRQYNITHVHKGHAFENALIDAMMQLQEHPGHTYVLGGVDEIGTYNYNIEYGAGWYKKKIETVGELYNSESAGTIAGEGAAMFLVNDQPANAIAGLIALSVFHSGNTEDVAAHLKEFIATKVPAGETIDVFVSGENGDNRYADLFYACESLLNDDVPILRFKHLSGEYPTATAFALWLACSLPIDGAVPAHLFKRKGSKHEWKNILIYNFYQGVQHSFLLLKKYA